MAERLKVRISRSYDYDLYCLYLTVGKKQFSQIVKDALLSFVTETEYEPSLIKEWVVPEAGSKKNTITINLSFDNSMTEVLNCLARIEGGKKGSFIKTVLRIYYASQMVEIYTGDKQKVLMKKDVEKKSIPKIYKTSKKQTKKEKQLTPVMEKESQIEDIGESVITEIPNSNEQSINGPQFSDLAALFGMVANH